jgi:hypothetical protein
VNSIEASPRLAQSDRENWHPVIAARNVTANALAEGVIKFFTGK